MNADEAKKCLLISKQRHSLGDEEGALKFALKSLKLGETREAKDWLESLKNSTKSNDSSRNSTSQESRNSTSQESRNSTSQERPMPSARATRSSPQKQEEPAASRPFTQDQVQGIKKILSAKKSGDLYGVLGLEKGCNDNQVKKAYRKMALLYHPDKCGAPGTDDAFKAIGHAWTVLGDPDKKSNYDRFGVDSESSSRGGGGGGGGNPFASHGFHGFGGHPGFEAEISPEELLRMFMGGGAFGGGPQFSFNAGPGFQRTRGNFHRRQRNQQPQESHGIAATIFQLLPILLLFFLSSISFFTSESEPFSFQKSFEYSMQKVTAKHNVQYYVNPRTFDRRFSTPRRKRELAESVESNYLQHLKMKCSQERQNQQFMIRQASSWFTTNQKQLDAARNMKKPFCDELNLWFQQY